MKEMTSNDFKVAVVHTGASYDGSGQVENVVVTTCIDEDAFIEMYGDVPRLVYDATTDVMLCDCDPTCQYGIAWRFDSDENPTKVVVDMVVARAVKLNLIREVRNAALNAWDKHQQIAQWKNDTDEYNKISKHKEALRNVPQDIEDDVNNATTCDELNAIQPISLTTDMPQELLGEFIPIMPLNLQNNAILG